MSRKSLSYRLTDPKQKPSFRGKRFRYMVKLPERLDLWDEFVVLQQADWQTDPRTHKAHEFYTKNRAIMDTGAAVGNPHRRGDQIEASAIESYFVEVARIGQDSVSTEYDNDPPEETGPVESGITSHLILQHMSGYERCVIPPGCVVVTQGIDVGKYALHYVVRAWRQDGTGYVIDKGVQDVTGTSLGQDIGVEHAILQALRARMETASEGNYRTIDGEPMPVDLTLIDAGYKTDAVYAFCRESGLTCRPAMGIGKSAGCVRVHFQDITRQSKDRKPGDHWFLSRQPNGVWLVNMDADYWKSWEHARWLTATDKPGTMFLYGTAAPEQSKRRGRYEIEHFTYSKHICAEIEVEEPVKGVLVRRWRAKSDTNHFFDASYMADVAANMKGIRLIQAAKGASAQHQGGWFEAQDNANKRRRA